MENKLIITPFAKNAAEGYRNNIPEDVTTIDSSRASYKSGFPVITSVPKLAGGKPPEIGDFNGILCDLSTAIQFIQGGNFQTYNLEFATAINGYSKGAVIFGSDSELYTSLVDNNLSEPGRSSYWEKFNDIDIPKGSINQDGIVQLSSATNSDDETKAATSKAIKTVMDMLNSIKSKVGDFRLFPFRTSELPFGWYFRGGDNFLLGSPQGRALNSLSTNYKADHGITIKTISGQQYINVPNAFSSDGRGYFERASRQAGNIQDDAIRNIIASFGMDGVNATSNAGVLWGFTGALFENGTNQNAVKYGGNAIGTVRTGGFDASRVVPTAEENRPLNIGMTPAIYLGV